MLAGISASLMICKGCGAPDAMVRERNLDRHVTWPDGRKFVVEGWRCLACASQDRAERSLPDGEEARDGRRRIAREIFED